MAMVNEGVHALVLCNDCLFTIHLLPRNSNLPMIVQGKCFTHWIDYCVLIAPQHTRPDAINAGHLCVLYRHHEAGTNRFVVRNGF